MEGISSPGIGSGLDITTIITKLMEVQNKPVMLLQTQEAKLQTTLSAFGSLKSALSQFQTSLQNLKNSTSYQTVSATIANTSVAKATATSAATAGTYSLEVKQLAQAQALIAAGQTSSTNPIGTGTISFNFGTTSGTIKDGKYAEGATFTGSGAASKTVTIDASNNSLTGIAAAINAANIGVTAGVLNDGSNAPYRLSLMSTNTGQTSSMQIAVSGDTALGNLLNQDPTSVLGQQLTQKLAAQDAQFTLNGLAIASSKNTNSSAIPGVTLDLLSTNDGTPTTLSVSRSNDGAAASIKEFVSAYNTVQSAISKSTSYNADTKTAGPLQGQNSVLSISKDIQRILNAPVLGAQAGLSMLTHIGIGFNNDGTMIIDDPKLQAALAKDANGVTSLFTSLGSSTDALVSYQGTTNATKAGTYGITITQLATQGNTTGSAAANTTITAGVNDTLQVNLNGVTADVALAAGSYTKASLASAVQSAINANTVFSLAKHAVSVTENDGILSISSTAYGSTSVLAITGGNGYSSLLGDAATVTAGTNVAGSIDGQVATGKGQILTASSGNAAGLSVQVNGGTLGARGTINFTQGYINELTKLMSSVVGESGQIASMTSNMEASIKDIQSSITTRLSLNQQVLSNLQEEYLALDVILSKLSSTSSFLTQQLSALTAQTKFKS